MQLTCIINAIYYCFVKTWPFLIHADWWALRLLFVTSYPRGDTRNESLSWKFSPFTTIKKYRYNSQSQSCEICWLPNHCLCHWLEELLWRTPDNSRDCAWSRRKGLDFLDSSLSFRWELQPLSNHFCSSNTLNPAHHTKGNLFPMFIRLISRLSRGRLWICEALAVVPHWNWDS